ncbi:unnamed protein product [Discula destructiva]
MAKRPYAESGDQLAGGGSAAKKVKMTDAMENLTDRADDLIESLQALKRQGKSADAALMHRLTSLSRELLPSFQLIAKADDTTEEPATPPTTQTPVLPVLTPWRPFEIAHRLPPLPPILDPSLERASFTHAGAVRGPADRSYEQLEWLGDAYLYLMATAYIYLTFPHLKHGDMAQIREVLVRNATLKDYSIQYGFDKQLVLPMEYSLSGRLGGTTATAKERNKVLGDVFEARVAAVILSDPVSGVANTASWLKLLWSTTISNHIKNSTRRTRQAPLLAPMMGSVPADQQQPQAPQSQSQEHKAKDKLNVELALHAPKVFIDYRSLDEGQSQKRDALTNQRLFTQGAYLVGYGEDVLLGSGKDKKKKEANEKAAQNALQDKATIDKYRAKKQAILKTKLEAQQEASKGLDF